MRPLEERAARLLREHALARLASRGSGLATDQCFSVYPFPWTKVGSVDVSELYARQIGAGPVASRQP